MALPYSFHCNLGPTAGRGAEIYNLKAWFENMKFIVYLGQLKGGAGAVTLGLGGRHVRVVDLALEPAGRRILAAMRGFNPYCPSTPSGFLLAFRFTASRSHKPGLTA
jgi:hypothetical protein|tara:strand:- start:8241 stop:8561 length:321 start_codon:yes stop_codon:yes gene_type:complete